MGKYFTLRLGTWANQKPQGGGGHGKVLSTLTSVVQQHGSGVAQHLIGAGIGAAMQG